MIELTKEKIDQIFEEARKEKHQTAYMLALYKLALPEWDRISKCDWPEVSEETAEYVMSKAMEFDREFHPDVLNGGAWMNSGFKVSDNKEFPDWMIDTSNCKIEYVKEITHATR